MDGSLKKIVIDCQWCDYQLWADKYGSGICTKCGMVHEWEEHYYLKIPEMKKRITDLKKELAEAREEIALNETDIKDLNDIIKELKCQK